MVVVRFSDRLDLSKSFIDFVWKGDETLERFRRGESAFRIESIPRSIFPFSDLGYTFMAVAREQGQTTPLPRMLLPTEVG